MLYIICLVIDFVDIYEYLGQKPDLSRCVCSNHDRLGFYADINKNHLMGLGLTLFCGDPQEGDDIRVRVQSPYGAQSYLVLRRPPGG